MVKRALGNIALSRVDLVSICLISFLLPFHTIVNVWILMLVCLFQLYLLIKGVKKIRDFELTKTGPLILLYAAYIVGLLYSRDLSEALIQLKLKLPLLVFPLLFMTPGIRSVKFSTVIQFFIAGCLLSFIVCLVIAFNRSFDIVEGKPVLKAITYASGDHLFLDSLRRNSNYFFGKYLSYFMHPTYFSMYLGFAFVGLLEIRKTDPDSLILKSHSLHFSSLSLMVIAILMLLSKAGIIILFILSIFWILFRGGIKLRLAGKIISVGLLILVFGLIIRFNPRFQTSIQLLQQYSHGLVTEEYAGSTESVTVRLFIWKESLGLIEDNLLFGVGTGDVGNALLNKYEDDHLSGAAEKKYNAHNQYFETCLALGLIGFLILLFALFSPLSFVNKKVLPTVSLFIIIIGINYLFESMLNRQAGAMFFAFFYSLFMSNELNLNNQNLNSLAKSLLDRILSFLGLLILLPPGTIIALAIKLDSKGPVFYRQTRIGRYGREFNMIKFRTMHPNNGSTVSVSKDPRITRVGKYLRRWKLDELPEFWNILKGEMSFVGPRPDVPGFADRLEGENRKILQLRPGLTGPASIKYANEEFMLSKVKDPERYNQEVIWPDKVKVNLEYLYRNNIWMDFKYILQSLFPKKKKT